MSSDYFAIESPCENTDPELLAHREIYGDFQIYYTDEFSVEHDREVDESVEALRSVPGVAEVNREGRELLLVWGTELDAVVLKGALQAWWSARLTA